MTCVQLKRAPEDAADAVGQSVRRFINAHERLAAEIGDAVDPLKKDRILTAFDDAKEAVKVLVDVVARQERENINLRRRLRQVATAG